MNADNKDFKYKELTEEIIRIFYRVYNILGYGFLEKVYENAMMIELNFGTKPEVKRKAFDNLRK
ncbi:MAG: GxxExxY protein [Halobacteriota archaeon]